MNSHDLNAEAAIPIIRPTLPRVEDLVEVFRESYESGSVTIGRVVRQFELEASRLTGASYAVAVSSCTSGLMLALAALKLPEGSEVVVPSFTFPATVQAILWNRLTPVYVDCLPGTMTMDPDEASKGLSAGTAAVCPVTIFGLPPDIDELTAVSNHRGVPLIFDSAQGLGSMYKGKPAGTFGMCEVFSLSPTKVITAIEGGLVTTEDRVLAEALTSMRDYGKGPDAQGMIFNGLSARMSEIHGAVGLLSLRNAEALISSRLRLIRRYRERVAGLTGCRVQEFPADRSTSGNYFTIHIGGEAKKSRDSVQAYMAAQGIQTRKYFSPPVHLQALFRNAPGRTVGDLPHTTAASRESLALPLFAHMTDDEHERVCAALDECLQ